MKQLLFLFLLFLAFFVTYILSNRREIKNNPAALVDDTTTVKEVQPFLRLQQKALSGKEFALQHGLSTEVAFLLDMSLHSGKNRFFVYDFVRDTITSAAPVAHGSCNTSFSVAPVFSNEPGCGCTSVGRYKIGNAYEGNFGKAYKLHGLDSSNSNAYQRYIVLHGYSAVPEKETYPQPICNSLGCPMVAYSFLDRLSGIIEKQNKPVLLWIYQ